MSKGSWDRSDPNKKDQSEYWKPENVEKRKMLKDQEITFPELDQRCVIADEVITYAKTDKHDQFITAKRMQEPNVCTHCDKIAWAGTKRNPSTKCEIHFACVCDKCGHESFWIKNKWVCFSLSCNWSSKEYTKSIMEDDDSAMKRKA